MKYVSRIPGWLHAHSQVWVLSRLLQVEKPRKHHRITFGGHAAVVIDSGVEWNAIRQQPFLSTLQAHRHIVMLCFGKGPRPPKQGP